MKFLLTSTCVAHGADVSSVTQTLGVQASFASLVLCNLVQGMFPAVLVFAERPLSLRNVHLRSDTDLFAGTAGVDEHVALLPVLLPLCQGKHTTQGPGVRDWAAYVAKPCDRF